MKSLSTLVAAALVAASPLAFSADKLAHKDAKAIKDLAEANRAEVELGKLAMEKASNPEVKKFAEHMVDAHGKMLQEVQTLADSKGVKLSDGIGVKNAATKKRLEHASGDKFDKDYVNAMVKDHRADVKDLEKMSRSVKDTEVKAAVDKALPDVKEHLQHAEQLAPAKTARRES
jgi:predicted outer membrane protein